VPNGFVQILGLDRIERSQIAIQHHPPTTNEQNDLLEKPALETKAVFTQP
jgi:hypothetical protein